MIAEYKLVSFMVLKSILKHGQFLSEESKLTYVVSSFVYKTYTASYSVKQVFITTEEL